MSEGPTDEEVIKYRQAHCKHAFIRGFCDKTATCAHCGLRECDYVPPLVYFHV